MDEASIEKYLSETFADLQSVTKEGTTFFFYGPDRMFPFATIVTRDNEYDRASQLDRPSVFRLNIGVSKATFATLFGATSEKGVPGKEYDYTVLDQLMPHPVYGHQSWMVVLNPTVGTFQSVLPLLAEAYSRSVRKHTPNSFSR